MPPPHELGPANASLRVLTRRQGVAAKVGHDLVLEVGQWNATLRQAEPPDFELEADSRTLRIVEGTGGAKPLSDGDRKKIAKNIDDDVLHGKPIRFRTRGPGQGELELDGTTKPASFELTVGDDGAFTGRATVLQSEWGIKPYTAMLGALKVADEVEITVSGRLP